MSTKGIFTALSGAIAQSKRLDTVANNIANSSTTGFKKDVQTFNEYMTKDEKLHDVPRTTRIPASIDSFYDQEGADKSYVDSNGTYTDFSQGQLKPTGNTLDVALEGTGFFEILSPNGIRYTRNGGFKMNSQGELVTKDNYPVLKEDPTKLLTNEQRKIKINKPDVTISYTGDVYASGENLGRLSIFDAQNPQGLQKEGASYYLPKEKLDPQLVRTKEVQAHQGFLEGSNLNIVTEMTDMISATRAFETNKEVMKAFDQMNGKLVNDVPRTS